MSYYKVLGFQKEPFSTSPDPDFFYLSRQHETALTNILIELRLKRGLSVILGDIGTGKTTLSRKLIQELKCREDCLFHMVLDPSFETSHSFLAAFAKNFDIKIPSGYGKESSIEDLRGIIENFLFQKGVIENKTVVLIVDEAQKMSEMSLEILRVLLNYETNTFKLLQLVLLGQMELQPKIRTIPNFFDRVSFKSKLDPLGYEEMTEMIFFRLKQAGYQASMDLFLAEALHMIYDYTRGYPRQVTLLCHRALKSLLLKNKFAVDGRIIEGLIEEEIRSGWQTTNPLLQKSSY